MKQVMLPCSVGEAFDKLTILEIKSKHLHVSDSRQATVEFEILGIKKALSEVGIDFEMVVTSSVVVELFLVNSRLWNIEDQVRILWKKVNGISSADFEKPQPDIVEFAREAALIPVFNDRRAELKNKINQEYGSAIHEVKHYAQGLSL